MAMSDLMWNVFGREVMVGSNVIPVTVRSLAGGFVSILSTAAHHRRVVTRYGSGSTHVEWLILSPFLLPPRFYGCSGELEMRGVANAIFFVPRGGISPPPVSSRYRGWPGERST